MLTKGSPRKTEREPLQNLLKFYLDDVNTLDNTRGHNYLSVWRCWTYNPGPKSDQ